MAVSRRKNTVSGRILFLFVSLVLLCVYVFPSLSAAKSGTEDSPLETLLAMSLEELIEVEVSIATRRPISVRKAPAIATVITAEEIRSMGARNLLDVIERIPGVGVTRGHYSVYAVEIRGLKAVRQNKIRFLLDGHTLNMSTVGEPFWGFEDIPVEEVERVEVIRGPGSALYGANAFTGVINVVTKKGSDVNGTQVSAGVGTFETGRVNLLHGKRYGDKVDVLGSLSYGTTDGAGRHVEQDALGQFGPTDDWARTWDGLFKVSWEGLVLESRYTWRKDGPYVGVTNAINDGSELKTELFYGDLSYSRAISDQWNVNARAYYNHAAIRFAWQIFPPGMAFSPDPAHFFPEGVFGTPGFKDQVRGAEIESDYAVTDTNTVTVGAVYEYGKQYDVTHHTNFDPMTMFNLGSFQDISDWGNWNIPTSRTTLAAFIQDEWRIRDDLSLTVGLRHDDVDDVGGSTNPRLGLVWEVTPDLDFKLLYGQAFRIPTFDELYSINNPASVGNPELDPEEMTTYEISLGYSPNKWSRVSATGFYNKFTDKIDLVPTDIPGMLMFQNTGDATIYGVEVEARYRFGNMEVYGNYFWDDAEDDKTDKALSEVPSYRWNLGLDFRVSDRVKGNLHCLHVGDRPRSPGDVRDKLDGYTTVDANVIFINLYKMLELRASVYNIFDEDYAYPAPAMTLLNDYPAPGISVFFEARFTF